jgi:murein DD-endopeptidase MepM/ murein hydrolase activator NlpD
LAVRDATAKRGRQDDRKVYAPNIIFPLRLETGRFAAQNTQIWGYGGGGYNGAGEAGGTECDPRNYDPMQQRDNFCEVRGWSMPLCPSGEGHQGQDIRPPSCKDNTWDVVAVVDGIITLVTSNTTVKLKGNDGTVYEYLHMHPNSIKVKEGSKVKQGDVVGRVSKYMNGTRSTTYHLHFNVRQRIEVGSKVLEVYVPPYASLVAAYRRGKGLDAGVDATGELVPDPMLEIGVVAQAPPAPSEPQPAPASPPSEPTPPAPAPTPSEPAPPPTPPAPAPSAPAEPPAPPQPAPSPPPAPEPPAPPAPAPSPPPAPPQPAPSPAPEPPAPPTPTPAPPASTPPAPPAAPTEEPKSWWQRGIDKAMELWKRWSK